MGRLVSRLEAYSARVALLVDPLTAPAVGLADGSEPLGFFLGPEALLALAALGIALADVAAGAGAGTRRVDVAHDVGVCLDVSWPPAGPGE